MKEINGQIFINSRHTFKSDHPSRSFYNKLKNDYCKKRGFVMCDAWLDFQNFALWWDLHYMEGKQIKLNQESKIINAKTCHFS